MSELNMAIAKNATSKNSAAPARSNRSLKAAQSPSTKRMAPAATRAEAGSRWTFLTNHAHVLILLSQDPSMVLRQVAQEVGITERAVQRIIVDLEESGFIEREKVGRQNHYRILAKQALRHPIESHRTIGDLLSMIQH